MQKLVDAIVAAGGRRTSGAPSTGRPRGRRRAGRQHPPAFLYDPAHVSFVDRAGGDATTAVGVTKVQGKARLTVSPGRIDPANEAWKNSRKPLAGEFAFRAGRSS